MDKTCGNCRFKGKDIEKNQYDEDGILMYEMKPTGYFLCERIKHDQEDAYKRGQAALVVDGSGYYAALCVENDFGCNLWEGKA